MAAPSKAKALETDDEPVVDSVWLKLQTENAIPPLEFAGLTLLEPTKTQIDAWHAATTIEDGEKALFGDQYQAVHNLLDSLPKHVWENFNALYMKHFFGAAGDDDLKG